MGVVRAAGAATQHPRGLQVGTHPRDQRADHPDVAHGPLADAPHRRVGDALLEASAEQPESGASRADSSVVQTDRRNVRQGETGFPDEVGGGHCHVREAQLG